MRFTLLAIMFAFTGIQCVETTCHPGPACDPNTQVAAATQVVGADCGTFTIDNNNIVDPNQAAICAHQRWQDGNFPTTFTFRAIAGDKTNYDVYLMNSASDVQTIQGSTSASSDGNKVAIETCNTPQWVAVGNPTDPCSPNYGNYQFQCTTYTNPNVLCNSAQVCD